MTKILRTLMMVIVLSSLFSCATGVPYTKLNPSTNPEAPETGRVFFYRVTAMGAALQPQIVMNGESVGTSIAKGFFFLDIPPGEYEVVTSTEVERKVSFVLDEGQTQYIRFNVGMGFFVGHVYGELVDAAEALQEIQKCKYTEDTQADT